jgi:hypothetical protein
MLTAMDDEIKQQHQVVSTSKQMEILKNLRPTAIISTTNIHHLKNGRLLALITKV